MNNKHLFDKVWSNMEVYSAEPRNSSSTVIGLIKLYQRPANQNKDADKKLLVHPLLKCFDIAS